MGKFVILLSFIALFPIFIHAQSYLGINGNAGVLFSNVTFSDDKGSQNFFKNVSRVGLSISGNKKILPLSFGEVYAEPISI